MFHAYYRWRYERKSRAGAFTLPKMGKRHTVDQTNLSSYLWSTSGVSRGLRPFDKSRKRRRRVQIAVAILFFCFLIWIAYESLVALALVNK